MQPQSTSSHVDRFERLPTVMARTGMGRSWLYREIAGQRFPKPYKIGGASCWRSREIDAWIEQQVARA